MSHKLLRKTNVSEEGGKEHGGPAFPWLYPKPDWSKKGVAKATAHGTQELHCMLSWGVIYRKAHHDKLPTPPRNNSGQS
jgi:hypothetical protein